MPSGSTLRYSSKSKGVVSTSISAGDEVPYLEDITQNIDITTNSSATVTNIHYASDGKLVVKTDNNELAIFDDTIKINSNQFTDETGGVLSGILVLTFDGDQWVPSIENS